MLKCWFYRGLISLAIAALGISPAIAGSISSSETLAEHLAAQDFRVADALTRELLDQAAGNGNWSEQAAAIARFPCSELQALDELWGEASDGRFGIGSQAQRWSQLLAAAEPTRNGRLGAYRDLTEQVGWATRGSQPWDYRYRVRSELSFTATAPAGHLPALGVWGVGRWPEGMMGPPPGAPVDIGGLDRALFLTQQWWERAIACERATAVGQPATEFTDRA